MDTKKVKSSFTIHEVVAITGFTKYMLDYLAREKIFEPSINGQSGRGSRRRYSYEDLVLLRALYKVCDSNGKIRHLREALLEFRKEFGPFRPGQKIDQHLFVQGKELCVFTSTESGKQIRSGQMAFSFVIDLSTVANEISNCVTLESKTKSFVLTEETARKAEEERQRIWAPVKLRRAAVK